jgi:SAM-dependent methyltransferase
MIRKFLHELKKRGFINSAKALYSKYWFEIRYGLKMNPSHQRSGNSTPLKGHQRYEPVGHFTFNRMMKKIDWNFRESTFLDFGCGKGAAIILASRYGFRKYIGVEYDPGLVIDCKANLQKFVTRSGREIRSEIICCDAALYTIPDDVNVFFFFNPFESSLLELVLQNIEESLKACKRDILLLYFNALHKDSIEKYGYSPVYSQNIDKINVWYTGGNYAFTKLSSRL